jgi:hypothetical protein
MNEKRKKSGGKVKGYPDPYPKEKRRRRHAFFTCGVHCGMWYVRARGTHLNKITCVHVHDMYVYVCTNK